MLIRFGVENHNSLRNYQELLLTAGPFKEPAFSLLASADTRVGLVPAVAVYGANAAGKSTVLAAMTFMRNVIVESHKYGNASGGTPYAPFALDSTSRSRSSKYDIDFELDDTRFHYGFRIDGKSVNEEWLFATLLTKRRRTKQTWFHRSDAFDGIYFGKALRGENKTIERMVRSNSLFLSAAAQNAHPQLSKIHEYFDKQVLSVGSLPRTLSLSAKVAAFFKENHQLEERAIDFLRMADTGIAGIKYKSAVPDQRLCASLSAVTGTPSFGVSEAISGMAAGQSTMETVLLHKGEKGSYFELPLETESTGTKALLAAIGEIVQKLQTGGVLLVDELSNALHPLMSRKIVQLFSDPTVNTGKAQLIFSTHDTNLLCGGLFRRDQIWFAEKDREGATHLYPLTDIEVDKRDNLEKGYLQGRFGAVPFFSDIDEQWVSKEDFADKEN